MRGGDRGPRHARGGAAGALRGRRPEDLLQRVQHRGAGRRAARPRLRHADRGRPLPAELRPSDRHRRLRARPGGDRGGRRRGEQRTAPRRRHAPLPGRPRRPVPVGRRHRRPAGRPPGTGRIQRPRPAGHVGGRRRRPAPRPADAHPPLPRPHGRTALPGARLRGSGGERRSGVGTGRPAGLGGGISGFAGPRPLPCRRPAGGALGRTRPHDSGARGQAHRPGRGRGSDQRQCAAGHRRPGEGEDDGAARAGDAGPPQAARRGGPRHAMEQPPRRPGRQARARPPLRQRRRLEAGCPGRGPCPGTRGRPRAGGLPAGHPQRGLRRPLDRPQPSWAPPASTR